MHMVATNLCEWIYVLVEETKHEIYHVGEHDHHDDPHDAILTNSINGSIVSNSTHEIHKRATSVEIILDCRRTNIMGKILKFPHDPHVFTPSYLPGRLVQNASPFLFPCTIEYSLICAVILYEMWKKIKMNDHQERKHQESMMGHHTHKDVHHLSVDCSRAHRGMFAGILVIVLTIISLIMFFVLQEEQNLKETAVLEVTFSEICLYLVTAAAVFSAMYKMQDLKYSKQYRE
jgi:hypothetical protein